jgi:hypothetical protein
MSATIDIDTALAEGILQRCPRCGEVYAVLHECDPDAPGLQTADRCPDCGGVYGPPDLAADPYDFPCCCAWPPELAAPGTAEAYNPILGERFTQEDGRPGWYSSDGLTILRSTPIRAAFNAPDGRPLFVYPNLGTRPAQQASGGTAQLAHELADLRVQAERDRAEIARLQGIIRQQDEALARLADGPATEAVEQASYERAVERARRQELVRILECADLTPTARVTAALAADAACSYSLPLTFGEEPESSEPVAINVAELERRAGITPGSASKHLAPAAEAGVLCRQVRTVPAEDQGPGEFRTTVLIGPGTGRPQPRRRDLRRQRDSERKAAEREERARREAELRARVEELEAAAKEAEEHGCTICGGPLLPTGYFCPRCNCERTTAEMSRFQLGEIHQAPRDIYSLVDSTTLVQPIGNNAQDGQHRPRAPTRAELGVRQAPGQRSHPD